MIDWTKPIEPTNNYDWRINAKVIHVDGDYAVVVWVADGHRCSGWFSASTPAWINVPELSERDKRLLLYALGNPLGGEVRDSPHWFRVHAADLAREFGE